MLYQVTGRPTVLAGLVVVCLIACGCGPNTTTPTSASGPPTGSQGPTGTSAPKEAPDDDKLPADAPVVALTADEFYQEVSKDEKAAAARFKGKRIEVSGTVESGVQCFLAPTSGASHAAVGLATKEGGFKVVFCFLTNKDKEPWAKLAAGQTVKLRGIYPETQSTSTPAIRQCQIVEQGPSTAVVLTAEELAKEATAGKEATIEKYKAKGLVATGEIVKKEMTKGGGTIVSLKGDQTMEVQCEMVYHAEWMTGPLMVGQKVKLYGVVTNFRGDPKVIELSNCLVITQP